MKSRTRKAFTLIELIIVIVVLGILAAIAIVGYRSLIDRTNNSSAEASARAFDRNLRATAGSGSANYTINGQQGDISDTDPRKSVYLLEMLEGGDIPDQGVKTSELGGGSLRVLVYNNTSSTEMWTRLACDSDTGDADLIDCPDNPDANDYDNTNTDWIDDDTLGKLPGEYASSLNTGEILCIQFHKSGQDVFMGWPKAYEPPAKEPSSSTPAVVSNDIDKACDGANGVIGGAESAPDAGIDPVGDSNGDGKITSADTITYYDLVNGAAATTPVTDNSWGN